MSRGTLGIAVGAFVLAGFAAAACADAPVAMAGRPGSSASRTDAGSGAPDDPQDDDGGADPVVPEADAGARDAGEQHDRGSSTGCGKASPTGLQNHTLKIAGKDRGYLRFVPPGYDPQKPLALVIGLHGSCKKEGDLGCATAMRETMGLEAKAAGDAILVYPQALVAEDPALDAAHRWETKIGSDDYAFFDALVSEAEESLCIDRDRLFVAGFSLGARFTSMLGCYRGDTIRAIAPVAPGMTAENLPLAVGPCKGEVAVWEGLGDDDAEHRDGALLVRDYYRTVNGCSATLAPITPAGCQAYAGCRSEVPVTWCTYPGGHTWPSIGAGGVWGFFAAFR